MKTLHDAKDSVAHAKFKTDFNDIQYQYATSNKVTGVEFTEMMDEASELYAKNTALRFARWKDLNDFERLDRGWTSSHLYYSGCIFTDDELFEEWDKLGRP